MKTLDVIDVSLIDHRLEKKPGKWLNLHQQRGRNDNGQFHFTRFLEVQCVPLNPSLHRQVQTRRGRRRMKVWGDFLCLDPTQTRFPCQLGGGWHCGLKPDKPIPALKGLINGGTLSEVQQVLQVVEEVLGVLDELIDHIHMWSGLHCDQIFVTSIQV